MTTKPNDPTTNPNAENPDAPKIAKKVVNKVQQMQALFDGMSDEERERAQALGLFVPEGDITGAMEGKYKWGCRCSECNKIALYLVGDKWKNPGAPDGFDTVPPGWPHTRIPWTQNLPIDQIDRNKPRCQNCGAPVVLNSDRSFNRERNRIVQVKHFEAARDKGYDKRNIKALEDGVAKGLASSGMEDGLPSSYSGKERPVSQVIADQGRLGELEHIAERAGLNEATRGGLTKAL